MRAPVLSVMSVMLAVGCGAGAREVVVEAERPPGGQATSDGTSVREATPLAEPRRIASAEGYDCAIDLAGQLWCWLEGGAPRAIERFERTRALSTHAPAGCAVREDGTIGCFDAVDGFGASAIVFVDRARYAWTDVSAVARVASPCVILADDGALECLLPRYQGPAFFLGGAGLEQDREHPRVRVEVGAATDVASTHAQVCVVHDEGALSCFRPGHPPRRVEGLPPMRRVSLAEGSAEIVCAISTEDELVCFASRGAPRTVRIPGVRDVAVNGGVVCAVSREGRVACFGNPQDRVAFESSPRVIAGLEHVVQLSLGPRHGCAWTQDERVRCFDPSGVAVIEDVALGR